MRNIYDRPQNLQTTNACESWHASWNEKVGKNYPFFWVVVEELKKIKMYAQKFRKGNLHLHRKKSRVCSMPKSSG